MKDQPNIGLLGYVVANIMKISQLSKNAPEYCKLDKLTEP